jgi:hypothetical protein
MKCQKRGRREWNGERGHNKKREKDERFKGKVKK